MTLMTTNNVVSRYLLISSQENQSTGVAVEQT